MKLPWFLLTSAFVVSLVSVSYATPSYKGNSKIQSFHKAKKIMEKEVVFDHRVTLYCGARFDEDKRVFLPKGFATSAHKKRVSKVEWEHVVPAENFGRAFQEWRDGDSRCVDSRGGNFKGRKCAEKVNVLYRYMQSDLYNLYPAIGAVNAERGNKNFEALSTSLPPSFGSCQLKIDANKVEPPDQAKGVVARTYKYMSFAYPLFNMSASQKKLMDTWDKQFPVQAWECRRAKRIESIQGNENPFVKEPCKALGIW